MLFLNRSYWPDAEATGQLLTELCEDLAKGFDVTVIAGQPNQNPDEAPFLRRGVQVRHGVKIHRVWNSRFSKRSLLGRAVNLASYLALAAVASWRLPRPDIVVVETDPPLLCLLGGLLQRRRGCKLVVYLQDIYPDVAVALGKLANGRLAAWLRRCFFAVYRRADRVLVLSQDMQSLLVSSGVPAERIVCLPNWVDTDRVRPLKRANAFRDRHGLNGQFVVMYSGNMGLCQPLEEVLQAAARLRDRADILFLLVGDGASRRRLEELATQERLDNVRFLDYQPRVDLAQSLSAADLHLVPLDPRVTEFLMPSKLYGILASGTPPLVVAPVDCELARLARAQNVGLVVAPGDPAALADTIRQSALDRDKLAAMGRRARSLATERYDRRLATRRFGRMLASLR